MGSTCMRYDSSVPLQDFLLQHIGVNFTNDKIAQRALKTQMVGRSTMYSAVETIVLASGERTVWALVTSSSIHAGEICWKAEHEEMGPPVTRDHCPASILDLLTEATSTTAAAWRQRCRDNLTPNPGRSVGLLPQPIAV